MKKKEIKELKKELRDYRKWLREAHGSLDIALLEKSKLLMRVRHLEEHNGMRTRHLKEYERYFSS